MPDASQVIPPGSSRPVEIIPDELEASILSTQRRTSLESGAPLALYGVGYRVDPATPEAMARQYLQENASLLHLKSPDLGDLTHRVTRQSLAGATVRFTQLFKGVPVYKGEIAVHVDNDNTVTYVTNNYKSVVDAIDVTPTLAATTARQIAHDYLSAQGRLRYDQTRLFVYYNKGVTRLAYQVKVVPETPLGDWEVLVDAHTGEIFKAVDIALNYPEHPDDDAPEGVMVDGTGNVFNPDPLSSAHATYNDPGFTDGGDADTPQLHAELVNVTLRDIQFSVGQYTLIGPYAHIVDSESPYNGLFSQASSAFDYNRFDSAFEAVNTYYHIDTLLRYANETLGVSVMPIQYTGGARYDPHGLGGDDNSHYSPSTGEVAFGEGGVDDAEDADVIYHELGHAMHDWVTNGHLSQVNGLSEGTGDYWAQSYSRSLGQWAPTDTQYHWVFNWDGHNPFWAGRDTNSPDHYPEDLTGNIYHDGSIWATCLMKVWDAIGRAQTDKALFEGLATTGASSGQNDAANAMYQAAIDLGYPNADRYSMHTILTTCGYTLPPFVPDGVVVAKSADPSPVAAGEVLTYSLAVENTASDPRTGVVMSDTVPTYTTYVPGSATCGGLEAGGTLTFSLGALNAGAAVTCTFQVVVSAGLSGPGEAFSDDMESGAGNWTHQATQGTDHWAISTGQSHSPTHAWFVPDDSVVTDSRLWTTTPITLEDGIQLTFWHRYQFEGSATPYDGAVLEASTNGGSTWSDLGAYITSNGYNGMLSTGYQNPLGGQQAWTGDLTTWSEVVVDLSSFAGQSVQFRWRLGCDSSQGDIGWYIDDVRLATAGDVIDNTACVASDQDTAFCDTISTPVTEPSLPPQIVVSPASLAGTLPPNVQAVLPLTISNDGGQALNWTIEEDSVVTASRCELPREDITWASAAPASGTTTGGSHAHVDVTFHSTGMPAGVYTGTLCIDSNDPITPLVSIPLTLTVSSASDVGIHKSVTPAEAAPGQLVTFTLSFSNSGNLLATGVVITDVVPGELSALSYQVSSEMSITPTGSISYAWQVQNLAPGQGGAVTITGQLSLPLAAGVLDNVAQIVANEDGNSLNDSSSVSFTVLNVAPDAMSDDYTVAEDSAGHALYVLANDGDANGDSLIITSIGPPDHGGALSIATSTLYLVYTPAPNFFGLETFSYLVGDGALTDTTTVSIHVMAVNDAPVAAADVYTTIEDTPRHVAAPGVLGNDTDADGDVLTATLLSSPEHGALTLAADGAFTYTPGLNWTGVISFSYAAGDGVLSDTAAVIITVTAVNDAPVAVADVYTTTKDTPRHVAAPGVLSNDTDADGDVLTATLLSSPEHGALTLAADGSFTYTPTLGASGVVSFTYAAGDGVLSDTAEVLITVTAASCIEVASLSLALVTPGPLYINSPLTFEVDVTPGNVDPYTYTINYDDGVSATLTSMTRTLVLSHTYTAVGTYTVGIEAWNCTMEQPVSDTLQLTLDAPVSSHTIFLPIVIKNSMSATTFRATFATH